MLNSIMIASLQKFVNKCHIWGGEELHYIGGKIMDIPQYSIWAVTNIENIWINWDSNVL
jgi:hypothetical protein